MLELELPDLLFSFHKFLPSELRKLILRFWYGNYYREFCQCGAKKDHMYHYDIATEKFYRSCSYCGYISYPCRNLNYEINQIWPYVDHMFNTEIISQFRNLKEEHLKLIDDILYQDHLESRTHAKYMEFYNLIFKEACLAHGEENLYFLLAWQMYKAKKKNIPEDRIKSIRQRFRYLGRYYIPAKIGTMLMKRYFACTVDSLS